MESKMSSLILTIKKAYHEEKNGTKGNLGCTSFYKNNLRYRPGDDKILSLLDRLANSRIKVRSNLRKRKFRMTPLMYALKYKRGYEVIHRLIDKESDINARCSYDKTALSYAVHHKYNSTVVAEILSKGACVDNEILYEAVSVNDPEIVKLLIKAGADRVKSNSSCGSVFLSIGCQGCEEHNCSCKQTIDILVSHGFDMKQVDQDGSSIIHEVSCNYLISTLIKSGVLIDTKNNNGHSPLDLAICREKLEKVRTLIRLGANPNCLDFAIRVDTSEAIINFLIFNGADISLDCVKSIQPLIYPPYSYDYYLFDRHTWLAILKNYLLFFDDNKLDYQEFHYLLESREKLWKYFKEFFLSCKKEITRMKEIFINRDLTIHQFCLMKKTKQTKSGDVSFAAFNYDFLQIKVLFPVYKDVIVIRMKDNSKRRLRRILRKGLEKIIFRPITVNDASSGDALNYDCFYYLSHYLSNNNLYNLFCMSLSPSQLESIPKSFMSNAYFPSFELRHMFWYRNY